MKRFWPLAAATGIVAVAFGSVILTGNLHFLGKFPLIEAIAWPIRVEFAIVKAYTPREWWQAEDGDPTGVACLVGMSLLALHYLAALALIFWGIDRLLRRRRSVREDADG